MTLDRPQFGKAFDSLENLHSVSNKELAVAGGWGPHNFSSVKSKDAAPVPASASAACPPPPPLLLLLPAASSSFREEADGQMYCQIKLDTSLA